MIELELKYEISSSKESLKELEVRSNKKQIDIYYDTNNYNLLKKGNFLRLRNNKCLEFKLGGEDDRHLFCKELTFDITLSTFNINDVLEVLQKLNINIIAKTIDELLSNLSILATIEKERTSYNFEDNCTISIDIVRDLGMFLEAEIMIDKDKLTKEDAKNIEDELLNKLAKYNILNKNDKRVNVGYVELYLLKYNKKAYELGMFKI